jgi:hypothetical protein
MNKTEKTSKSKKAEKAKEEADKRKKKKAAKTKKKQAKKKAKRQQTQGAEGTGNAKEGVSSGDDSPLSQNKKGNESKMVVKESEDGNDGEPNDEQRLREPPFPKAFGAATAVLKIQNVAYASGCCFCGTVRPCSP